MSTAPPGFIAAPRDAANPDVLDRIPLSARLVVDVGCGDGALGMLYKERNPRARVIGIERDPDAARLAATRLDHVVCTDVEVNPMAIAAAGAPDCIVYGDVLEHLRDPWGLLKAHAAALAPGGQIVASIPNLEHWSFAARLLRGDWAYEPSGLFDRTHLRWFTLRGIEQALREAGLHPFDAMPRIFDEPAQKAFVQTIAPALNALGIDTADYARRSAPLQTVWRAMPVPVEPFHVVAHMLAPEGGVSHVRVVYPARAVAAEPGVMAHLVSDGSLPDLPVEAPKVIVLHRLILEGDTGLRTLRTLLDRGYVVVTEFDDDPRRMAGLQSPELHTFTGVHAVQTTTPALAQVISRSNPNIAVFPNAVPALAPARNFATAGRLTLFFGGFNRQADWQDLMPALNEAAAVAGDRLGFQVVHDRAFFDALATPHKRFAPTCDHDTYLGLLGGCEFALMPLADTAFNRCKSDLKFIEAAAHRVAALASPVVYQDSLRHGQTGLLFHDAGELRQHLLGLLADPGRAISLAEAARAWVAEQRMLAYQAQQRVQWYRDLWERRGVLTDALLTRLPALAGRAP